MKLFITYVAFLFCVNSEIVSESDLTSYGEEKEKMEWLIGDWQGTGQLFGQKASFVMTFKNSLNNQFVELTFKNEFVTSNGTSKTMKANAFYKFKNDSIKGYWFDTRGVMLPLTGNVVDNTMIIFWGDENTERGKTTYQKSDDQIKVTDFYLKDEVYHQFGDATYKKRI